MANAGRKTDIIQAAYHMIAKRGLEGFRIRSLAEQAGINHATLLHYFPSKDAVIAAVVDYLLQQLREEGMAHDAATPKEALYHELDDFRQRLLSNREFFLVLSELQLRAYRDPSVAAPLTKMYAQWRQYLSHLIHQGIAARQFRADVPVSALVEVIIGQFRGMAFSALESNEETRVYDAINTFWTLLIQALLPNDGKTTEKSNSHE